MITKLTTGFDLQIDIEPSLSGDQIEHQRLLVQQLLSDLPHLSSMSPPESLAKFFSARDYLRRHAFPFLRDDIGALLNADPSQVTLPEPPPIPVTEEPKIHFEPLPPPPAEIAPTNPSPFDQNDPDFGVSYLEPSFEHDPNDPQVRSQYEPEGHRETTELCHLVLVRSFETETLLQDFSPERIKYLEGKYNDPSFDYDSPQVIDVQSSATDSDTPNTAEHQAHTAEHEAYTAAHQANAAGQTPNTAEPPMALTCEPERPRRADSSPLDDIAFEDKEKILGFLERFSANAVAKLISTPRPKGLGIPTSRASVLRFQKRFKAQLDAEKRAASSEAARQVAYDLAAEDKFIPATAHLLQTRLFDTVQNTELPVVELNHITRNLVRLQQVQTALARNEGSASRNSPRDEAGSPSATATLDVPRGTTPSQNLCKSVQSVDEPSSSPLDNPPPTP